MLVGIFHPLSPESRALVMEFVKQNLKTSSASTLNQSDLSRLVRRNPIRSLLSLVTSSSSQRTVLVLLLSVANVIITLRDQFASDKESIVDGIDFGTILCCLNLYPSKVDFLSLSENSFPIQLLEETETEKMIHAVQERSNDESKWKKRTIPSRSQNGVSPDLLSSSTLLYVSGLTRDFVKCDEMNPSYFDLLVTILKRHNVYSLFSLQVRICIFHSLLPSCFSNRSLRIKFGLYFVNHSVPCLDNKTSFLVKVV